MTTTPPSRPAGEPGRRTCPTCGASFPAGRDGTLPAHRQGTGLCPGVRAEGSGRAPTSSAVAPPSGETRPPRPRRIRTPESDVERRARRAERAAFDELEERPAVEDLDETLDAARARRGGLPTLGRRHH